MDELAAGVAAGEVSLAAVPEYEPPRRCPICDRRLVVQVRPDGWRARCSRHGELDSVLLEK